MNQDFLKQQFTSLFKKCQLYQLKTILQTPTLAWFAHWQNNTSKSFIVKNQKAFKKYFGKKCLNEISQYGFTSTTLQQKVKVTHPTLNKKSPQTQWVNIWMRQKQRRFMQSRSFLKSLYVILCLYRKPSVAEWGGNGGEIVLRGKRTLVEGTFADMDLDYALKFYGFAQNGIRLSHPYITSKASVRYWVLTELMAIMNVTQKVKPKVLGLDYHDLEIMTKKKFDELMAKYGTEQDDIVNGADFQIPEPYQPKYSMKFFGNYQPSIRQVNPKLPNDGTNFTAPKTPKLLTTKQQIAKKIQKEKSLEMMKKMKEKTIKLQWPQQGCKNPVRKRRSERKPPQYFDLQQQQIIPVEGQQQIQKVLNQIKEHRTIEIPYNKSDQFKEQFLKRSSALLEKQVQSFPLAYRGNINNLTQKLRDGIVMLQLKYNNQQLDILKAINLCNGILHRKIFSDDPVDKKKTAEQA